MHTETERVDGEVAVRIPPKTRERPRKIAFEPIKLSSQEIMHIRLREQMREAERQQEAGLKRVNRQALQVVGTLWVITAALLGAGLATIAPFLNWWQDQPSYYTRVGSVLLYILCAVALVAAWSQVARWHKNQQRKVIKRSLLIDD